MAANYDDVIDQLLAGGLVIDGGLEVGRLVRCKVEGDRERRGWYYLHELVTSAGDQVIVGSFGRWHGLDNGATKIRLGKGQTLDAQQRESLAKRLAEDRKKADAARQAAAEKAGHLATQTWSRCSESGESDYLARKGVGAHGVRFSPSGALVIPMTDVTGRVHGLQIIRSSAVAKRDGAPAKQYWPAGMAKKGHFHLIGGVPSTVLLVCEGYATGASLHEATGLPVAIAFDAGNLAPVASALRKRYKRVRQLVCADDDAFSEGNPGVAAASSAAVEVGGAWVKPRFEDEAGRVARHERGAGKLTDFNDLHLAESLHLVRVQIEARLDELGWSTAPAKPARSTTTGGAGQADALRPMDDLGELLDRFALVYGQGGTVFDRHEHSLLALGDMRDACSAREIHRAWMEHPDRAIVRVREVGFDPSGEDPEVTCNLWGGWPTVPVAGKCGRLLDLLMHMCSDDPRPQDLYTWVLRWLAYPIQHPGAKMKTTLVLHGPQGTGKNMFFEAVMAIYGHYGRIIDQSAIEDKFNDWASRKLFLIADEVVARSDLYHVKNKLKSFITGDRIRINPKNMAAYEERNHVNVVFLSNEAMPVVLEEDDRRHAVIWTPEKLTPEFYAGVLTELRDGGVAALHHHLAHLDLGEFNPGTLPPHTAARNVLIDLGMDSTARFWDELVCGDVPGVQAIPCLSTDFYEVHKLWCARNGQRPAPAHKLFNALERKRGVHKVRKRYSQGLRDLQSWMILPPNYRVPDGENERETLGASISSFKNALADYKGGVPM